MAPVLGLTHPRAQVNKWLIMMCPDFVWEKLICLLWGVILRGRHLIWG